MEQEKASKLLEDGRVMTGHPEAISQYQKSVKEVRDFSCSQADYIKAIEKMIAIAVHGSGSGIYARKIIFSTVGEMMDVNLSRLHIFDMANRKTILEYFHGILSWGNPYNYFSELSEESQKSYQKIRAIQFPNED